MDAAKVKEVIVSDQFDLDIAEIFEYGEKTFGHSSAKAFVAEIYTLIQSQEAYDWLGHGMYFWDNNERRAFQWAEKSSVLLIIENKY